ncbi:MAG: hypothetical protein IPN19_06060 [Elusimicrobia bacterium]|nr:hypothetical protein [Elusimicrobiota bacterium]
MRWPGPKTARLIYEDSDGVILEELVDLESRYGRRPMAHAVRVIGRMNVDNPKRNFLLKSHRPNRINGRA